MAKAKFDRTKPHCNIGTIGHVDHGDHINTRLQSPLYLFRYSPEPTANTTAPRHLNVPELMWRQEYSAI